jgi:hypothetical protein
MVEAVRHPKPVAWLAVALIAMTPLTGCGGGSTQVSASTYVDHVCNSVGASLHSVETSSAEFSRRLAPGSTPTSAKQALEGAIARSVADSEHVVSGLRAAGTPDVPEGEKIATAVVGSFQQATSALRGVQAQVKGLPTGEPRAFLAAAKQIGTSVRSSLASIGSGLASLHSEELQRAAAESGACRNLGAGSGGAGSGGAGSGGAGSAGA